MSMRTIRRTVIRGYRQQSQVTPELGARVLRLILAVCLGIDFAVGHPLWPTVVLICAVVALLVFSLRAMRGTPPSQPTPDEEDR